MRTNPLERLVAAARALPGERRPIEGTAGARPPEAPPSTTPSPGDAALGVVDVGWLRRRVGALLGALADRVEAELPGALEQAARAWDQADALSLLDEPLRAESRRLRFEAQLLGAIADDARRAAGLEAARTLEAALGLVTLLERRMATLIRLRLRAPDPELLPDGRPFLDVAAALRETARAWR